MKRKTWHSLAIVALLLSTAAFAACKGTTTKGSVKDSDSIKQAENDNVMLPDTAFQSVEDLVCEVLFRRRSQES